MNGPTHSEGPAAHAVRNSRELVSAPAIRPVAPDYELQRNAGSALASGVVDTIAARADLKLTVQVSRLPVPLHDGEPLAPVRTLKGSQQKASTEPLTVSLESDLLRQLSTGTMSGP